MRGQEGSHLHERRPLRPPRLTFPGDTRVVQGWWDVKQRQEKKSKPESARGRRSALQWGPGLGTTAQEAVACEEIVAGGKGEA